MAVITTYKCDKCGKEWNRNDDSEQPVAIKLILSFGATSITNYGDIAKTAMWCRECVMAEGLREPYTDKDKKVAPPAPPSFQDNIVTLFRELGFVHRDD